MTNYDAEPGSADYATQFWSSPEGRARAAAERTAREPKAPSRAEVIRTKLAAHDAALAAAAVSRYGTEGRPGILPGAEVEALQTELYALMAEAGDPFAERGRDVDLEAAFEAMR